MKKGWIVFLVVVSLFAASYLFSGFFSDDAYLKDKIVIIPIRGMISLGSMSVPFGEQVSSEIIVDYIVQANKEGSIKGIILDINSPGGTVVASKEISDAIKGSEKPVVALLREVSASGAYWIASSADKIVADPLTVTGSIGVMGSYLEFSGLMEEYGIGYERIISGKYKDMGSPFRELNDEEREILTEKMQKVHLFFIADVANNRNLSPEVVKEIAESDVYFGYEAKELGMVDYLGNKNTAINVIKGLANITEAELVKYQPKKSLIDLLSKISMESFYYLGKGVGSEMSVKDEGIKLIV